MANGLGTPRVGQRIGTVTPGASGGLEAFMTFWLQQYLRLVGRNPQNSVSSIAPGPSPYTYQNTGDFTVDAIVTGGTVSAVEFSRDGTTFFAASAGTQISLNPGDSLRVTYAVAPSITLIPR